MLDVKTLKSVDSWLCTKMDSFKEPEQKDTVVGLLYELRDKTQAIETAEEAMEYIL